MSLLSILLSVVAVLCTVLGFLTTPVPVLGAVLSFGAAALALGGIMLAGKAMSRAKREERPSDTARIAVVLNVLALVPALLVALTCGVCNALVSTGNFQASPNFRFNAGPFGPGEPDVDADQSPSTQAGAGEPVAGGGAARGAAGAGTRTGRPRSSDQPSHQPPPAQPSNNLPPPPLPAGPGR